MAYASEQDEGASPLFSPAMGPEQELAAAQVQGVLSRTPELYELGGSRWWLAGLRQVIDWMRPCSLPAICCILKRLGLSYRRGKRHVHSPDRLYDVKVARINCAKEEARTSGGRILIFYQDEHILGCNATGAAMYDLCGGRAPHAEQYAGFNGMQRLVGCLNPLTGEVLICRKGSMKTPDFIKYLYWVEEQCADAERIYLVLDNWSVHVSEDVQADLDQRKSRIHLLWLPTYAPWLNPIEKLWLCFNREVGHMHRHANSWRDQRLQIEDWLASLPDRKQEILRITGLTPKEDKHALFV